MTAQLKGELRSFKVLSADFWGVGTIRTEADGGDVQVTGKLLGAQEGDTIVVDGVWKQTPRYGRQFRVTRCEVLLPSDSAGVVAWLCRLPGIGRRRAEAMVERFGPRGVFEVLDSAPDRLAEVSGISAAAIPAIVDEYQNSRAARDRMVVLRGWGLTDNQAAKLLEAFGDDVVERVRANPYALIGAVPGFGWVRSDELARRMGIEPDSPARLRAGLVHTLGEAAAEGHTFVGRPMLVRAADFRHLRLGRERERDIDAALEDAIEAELVVEEDGRIYLPNLRRAERVCAAWTREKLGAA